jgi:DNA-binding MarR family transcriptional regulator
MQAIEHQARLGSTYTLLFHTAVAEHLGLNPSDHKVADILALEGEPIAPTRLAELTGLTTGAITGVLDRLESAGFVAREPDPADRRRIIVRVLPQRVPEVAGLFKPISARLAELCGRYTNEELSVILSFMRGSTEIVKASSDELRQRANSPARRKAAP